MTQHCGCDVLEAAVLGFRYEQSNVYYRQQADPAVHPERGGRAYTSWKT